MMLFIIPMPAWVLGLLIFYQSWSISAQNGGHLGGMLAGGGMYLLTRGRYGGRL